ncbi:MAG: cysteine hydrolase family protein, partial [bacterium]
GQHTSVAAMIEARPYPWPYDGRLELDRVGFVLIGPRRILTKCDPGQRVTGLCQDLLRAARGTAVKPVIVRYGHSVEARVSSPLIPEIFTPDWEFMPELAPMRGEIVIDAPTLDAYHATYLDVALRRAGIKYLVFSGFGTEAGVYATLATANDLGYDCLSVEDAYAGVVPNLHAAVIRMILNVPGIYGAVSQAYRVIEALGVPDRSP